MLTSYAVACPHQSCQWFGNLIPSLLQGGRDSEIASMQKAWFQCPSCQRDWEVQLIDDAVTVLPVIGGRIAASALSALPHPLARTEQAGNVKVITFTAGRVRDVENVIATELGDLADRLGESHLLLDFTNVEYISSAELGTLIGLHKKVKASGGRLTLFNLNVDVFEVFAITRLEKLLEICR
jgi:anti-sigma B factor antagonist